jgi:hypothetical protein
LLGQAAKPSGSGFCHVRFFTYLSAAKNKTSKIIHGMAKINIKSEKLTPFGGIFHVRNMFSRRKIGRKIGTVLLM